MIKFIYFDVANTLLRKADLVQTIHDEITKKNPSIKLNDLKEKHHNLVHSIQFPDHTTLEFYIDFNRKLLSLFNISDERLALDIFHAVKSLDWKPFEDAEHLIQLNKKFQFGVISNWGDNLLSVLSNHYPKIQFSPLIISSEVGFQKPSDEIFHLAANKVGYSFNEIMFVGDSLTLDYIPARKLGMKALLVDRDQTRTYEKDIVRIHHFSEIDSHL